MFIECISNNGTPYLRVVETYRTNDASPGRVKRRVLRNIGPLSRFDDGLPDYLARLRQSFRDGSPLIESLSDLISGVSRTDYVTVRYDRRSADECLASPKNTGYFILDSLYDSLGIYDVLNKHKSLSKIEYDLNGLAKLLVFGRALSPASKIRTFGGRDAYLFSVAKEEEISPENVYRALDCLHDRADAVQMRMNSKISAAAGRSAEFCFYDVTNFWFETDRNDEDSLDADGGTAREGMGKKGVSKENRSEPIVQMGLFTDSEGIPIAYRLFPGNRPDQTTLRPALEKSIGKMQFGKVVIVADGGLNSAKNIAHILDKKNGYIVSKSMRSSDRETRKWILDEAGYSWNETKTFRHKSKIRTRKIKDEKGAEIETTEKIVCWWSRKHYEKGMRENAEFIEYLNSAVENPGRLKEKPRKAEKFLEKTVYDKKTGEVIENAETALRIDEQKVQDYIDSLGYFTVMTSETEKTDLEIIDRYHGLSRIEDSFRITKSSLDGRPVYVRTPEHINAHFLVCFIALTMIRLIQRKILLHQGKSALNEGGWESGLSAQRIQEALSSWKADPLPGGFCRMTKPSEDLRLILGAFGIDPDLRLPDMKELRRIKYSLDKAAFM